MKILSYRRPKPPRRGGVHKAGLGVESLEARRLLASLAFTTQPTTGTSGSLLGKIQVAVPGGGSQLVTLSLNSNPGSMRLGGTTQVQSTNGTAEFDDVYLFGGDPGKNYSFLAYAAGFDAATSGPISIKGGAANLQIANIAPLSTAGTDIGATGSVQVSLLDANGTLSRDATGSVTIFLDRNPGGAALSGTLTVNAVNGVATFPGISLNKAGSGYTIGAVANGAPTIAPAISTPFAVKAAAATQLGFAIDVPTTNVNFPINMMGRNPPLTQEGVKVRALDAFGNFAPDYSGNVVVAIGTNPTGATLGGLTTVKAVGGIAYYNSLTIPTAGAGYTLTASSTDFAGKATSNPFSIVQAGVGRLNLLTPSSLTVGINQKLPTLTVQILDTANNVMSGDNTSQVTLNPTGVFYGTTTVTAVNGVATFDNVFMGTRTFGSPADKVLTVTAAFADIGFGPSNAVQMNLVAGAPRSLGFANRSVDDVLAGHPLTAGGNPIEIQVLDISNNVVDVDGITVSVGINQAKPNSLPTYLGQGTNPNDPTQRALYQTATTSHGKAVFDKLFINRASTQYQLAVGTTDFFNYVATTSNQFDVGIGAPAQVIFLGQPVAQVGSRMQMPGVGGPLAVAVADFVGNVVVSDKTTTITMGLNLPAGAPTNPPPTLGTGDPQGLTKTVVDGVAVFDAIYVDQAAAEVIPNYSLSATGSGLANPVTSSLFAVAPPPGLPIPNTLDFTTPPPATVGVNQTFSVTLTLSNSAQPGTIYGGTANVFLYLVDAATGQRTSGFGLAGTTSGVIPSGQNSITFSGLQINTASQSPYAIRAISDIGAVVKVSGGLNVGGSSLSSASGPVAATGPTPDLSPHTVGVGLGSYLQNFNYYQNLGVYKAGDIPPNYAPSDPNTPSRLVQPNVTSPVDAHPEYAYFNKVPVSTKWWSSLMFQRTQAVGIDERDSNGNRLFPIFADPFTAMVNSNDGGANDFAGLGLSHLTHLFVNPAPQWLDDPVPGQDRTKPNPLYPGNDQFFYTYYGMYLPDQRLYQDMSIGLSNLKADATVLDYSDWTATLNWSDAQGVPRLQAMLGQGMPFSYYTASNVGAGGTAPMRIATGNPNWQNFSLSVSAYDPNTGTLIPGQAGGTGAFQIHIHYEVQELTAPNNPTLTTIKVDNTYGVFVPTGIAWTVSGNTIDFGLTDAKNYVSVAALPDATAATFTNFRQHAYSFVTGTKVDFTYDESTATLATTYSVQTAQVETGAGILVNRPLQGLYLNLYRNLLPGTPLTTTTYDTVRGTLKIFDGPTFVTTLKHSGTLPQAVPLPANSNVQTSLWRTHLFPFLLSVSTSETNDGSLNLKGLLPTFNNNYQEGQAMLGAAQLIPILNEVADADPTANPDLTQGERDLARKAAELIYRTVADRMSAWLTSDDDDAPYVLYYQPQSPFEDPTGDQAGKIGWQAMMPVQGGFLSPEGINDQNLIIGYYVKTAAILAQYDRSWGQTSIPINNGDSRRAAKYGDIVEMLIRNVANFDRNDPMFPFLRNFDVLQGHSWADGSANDQSGTNQESSSESLNFASALIQWGEAIGDKALRDLGIYLYETEVESVNTYYFNVYGTDAFPEAFTGQNTAGDPVADRPVIPFPHSGSAPIGGFVGNVRSNYTGIEIVPFSGGSYYLGRDPQFVQRMYDWAAVNTSAIGQVPIKTPSYLTVLYPYLALADATTALNLYNSQLATIGPINPQLPIDTNAFNIHWMSALQAYGQVDATVTADTASSIVFIKGTVRTFVAYNGDPLPKTVHFTGANNTSFPPVTVPARTILVTDAAGNVLASRTTPDYSLPTPNNRFFVSGVNGTPALIQGAAGAGGQVSLDIPASGALTFTMTNVNGVLRPGSVIEDYAFYIDPGFHSDGFAPAVVVTFSYQNAGDASPTIVTFVRNSLRPQPGFIRADSTTRIGGPTGFHPQNLVNATVKVTIQQVEGDPATRSAIRLKTDGAAEQGRVSYFTLPYDILSVGSLSAVASAAAPQSSAAIFPAPPAARATEPLGHTYTAKLDPDGRRANFDGNASNDVLIFSAAGGYLRHNRATAGDPGFESDFDFDSTVPGVQRLAAAVTSQVLVFTGSGNDTVRIGTAASPASNLRASFSVLNGDAIPDTLLIDDSGLTEGLRYTVGLDRVFVGSDRLQVGHSGDFAQIALTTGSGVNTVTVVGVWQNDTLVLDTKRGLDVINIGNGETRFIFGTVEVKNSLSFSDIVVDNSRGVDASNIVTINNGTIHGIAPGTIHYSRDDIEDVEIYGGTNDGTYLLQTSVAGSYIYIDPGLGDDRIVVGDSGRIDGTAFPGTILLEGNGRARATFDDSQGTAKVVTLTATGAQGLNPNGVEFSGMASARLLLGPNGDRVTIASTDPATSYEILAGAGDDSIDVQALQSALMVDGGDGNDTITASADRTRVTRGVDFRGGAGADTLRGGSFNDVLRGGPGDDDVSGGDGDDLFYWNSGDGGEFIDGGAGVDRVIATASSVGGDRLVVAPAGPRGIVTIVGAAAGFIDLGGIENLDLNSGPISAVFEVTPLATTAVNVNGPAAPSPRAGNRVLVHPAATGTSTFAYGGPGAGSWTFSNAAPVTFRNMEDFNAPDNVLYVLGLYRVVLRREAGAGEPEIWISAIDAGLSFGLVASSFWRSREHRALQVADQFAAVLGRAPSGAEISTYVDAYLRGSDEAAVRALLLSSAEFTSSHRTPRMFVQGLYATTPGVASTPRAFSVWLSVARSRAKRRSVAASFLRSKPSATATIDATSKLILGRPADAKTLSRFVPLFPRGKATETDIAERFLASPEFLDRLREESAGRND